MKCIRPCLLTEATSTSNMSRLRSLIVRLSLPGFTNTKHGSFTHGKASDRESQPCVPSQTRLHEDMIIAGVRLARGEPLLPTMRVFYAISDDIYEEKLADCVSNCSMTDPSFQSARDSKGTRWSAWETSDSSEDSGPLEFLRWRPGQGFHLASIESLISLSSSTPP